MAFTRVTNSYMTNLFINDVRRNLSDITTLQHQISTGKRLQYPSDDPIGADRILDYQQTLDKTNQYVRNINDTKSYGQNLEGVLDTIYDILIRARDLAVRGANEAPMTQGQFDPIADEIDSLIHMLWTEANQSYQGKSMFSGFKTDTTPFTISNTLEYVANPGGASATLSMPQASTGRQVEAITASNSVTDVKIYNSAGGTWDSVLTLPGVTGITSDPITNSVTVNGGPTPFTDGARVRVIFNKDVVVDYNGDMGEKIVEVGPGALVKTNYVGSASVASNQKSVFGAYSADELDSSTVKAFQQLFDLRDNLYKYTNTANAVPGVTKQAEIARGIADIDEIIDSVVSVHSEQGGRDQRLTLAMNRHEDNKVSTKDLLSRQEDTDMTEAISRLVLMQNVYQAALGAGSRVIQTTLLDFLR